MKKVVKMEEKLVENELVNVGEGGEKVVGVEGGCNRYSLILRTLRILLILDAEWTISNTSMRLSVIR